MAEINLVPREYREKRERWKKIISLPVIIPFILLVLSLLLYGGLSLYQKDLQGNLDNIGQEIKFLDTKRAPDTEEEIVDLDKKLSLLKTVFQNHTYWSNVFKKIESLVIPEAYLFDAGLLLGESGVDFTFSANIGTYTNLARQILSFQEDLQLIKVDISGISLEEEGGIKFNLSGIFLDEVLFLNQEDKK